MLDFSFYAPRSWDELYFLLDQDEARLIAGGTDLIPLMRSRQVQPQLLVDLHHLPDLRRIRHVNGTISIGALSTHSDLARSELCRSRAPLLASAAASVGSPQIRSRGTIGGNIATASPAADTVPALLALDAEVVLVSRGGERHVPLHELLLGPGQIAIEQGEVIAKVRFSPLAPGSGSAFLKVGRRNALAVSVVNVAVLLGLHEGTVQEARIAVGALAPTVLRCRAVEQALQGMPLNEDNVLGACKALQSEIAPVTDLRAPASYRRLAAEALLRRALLRAGQACDAPGLS